MGATSAPISLSVVNLGRLTSVVRAPLFRVSPLISLAVPLTCCIGRRFLGVFNHLFRLVGSSLGSSLGFLLFHERCDL